MRPAVRATEPRAAHSPASRSLFYALRAMALKWVAFDRAKSRWPLLSPDPNSTDGGCLTGNARQPVLLVRDRIRRQLLLDQHALQLRVLRQARRRVVRRRVLAADQRFEIGARRRGDAEAVLADVAGRQFFLDVRDLRDRCRRDLPLERPVRH